MRVTDSAVDTQIAQLANEGDGLVTDIVAFFDVEQATPSRTEAKLAKRTRVRVAHRAGNRHW